MAQSEINVQALKDRLAPVYDETAAPVVMDAQARWRKSGATPVGSDAHGAPNPVADGVDQFGSRITEVRTIVPHETSGWQARVISGRFVDQYTTVGYVDNQGHDKWCIGTQFYISSDGTCFRLVDLPRETLHATFVNTWSLGIETGHLDPDYGPAHNAAWKRASTDTAHDDIPGQNVYFVQHHDGARFVGIMEAFGFRMRFAVPLDGTDSSQTSDDRYEVLSCWYTTAHYTGPAREAQGAGQPIFTDAQYRTWALLARYLAEAFFVPRNFPLLPHTLRGNVVDKGEPLRRIALADPDFAGIARACKSIIASIDPADFQEANKATFDTKYKLNAAIVDVDDTTTPKTARHSKLWHALFKGSAQAADHYAGWRGFHGHGFSGSITRAWVAARNRNEDTDHDCPGPLFDWHRFARTVYDWWWQPFDFKSDTDPSKGTSTSFRSYRSPDGTTPLLEYYFDAPPAGTYLSRAVDGIHGAAEYPTTFQLDAGTRVFAMANGQLVAARFPVKDAGVSMGFALVRHEVYHQPDTSAGVAAGRIDYSVQPTVVYSLYMHLATGPGFDFTKIVDSNPDWLNRVLKRKRECELGIAFYKRANHGGIPTADAWLSRPPPEKGRPTLLEGWQADDAALGKFLTTIAAGDVAIAPWWAGVAPIEVYLGDFLGNAGVIEKQGTTVQNGVRVEVLSTELLSAADFSPVTGVTGWTIPNGLPHSVAVQYQSEWTRAPTGAEATALTTAGVDPTLVPWMLNVMVVSSLTLLAPGGPRLPPDGVFYHYLPESVLAWINRITWASEWPKYKIKNPDGTDAAATVRPPNRRV